MRNAFAKEITRLAQDDPRVVLLSGDIGNRLFDDFKDKSPGRFYNCGVAESNMVGVAAGLAMSGLRPVCYTITPFITYRCMEQIRVDVCYHHVPVIIVGTGSGLSYASLGSTHHSCEEMGMLRLLPGLRVVAPADEMEVRAVLKEAFKQPDPIYIRIGKKGEPLVHRNVPELTIGKAIMVRPGTDVCLLAAGTMVASAIQTAELLSGRGLSCQVVSFHTIKPLDAELLADVFARFKLVATIEEHSILGGLGGSVAEWLADQAKSSALLVRFGTRDEFLHVTCEQEEAREFFGLTPQAISETILKRIDAC
jgi:transketolase